MSIQVKETITIDRAPKDVEAFVSDVQNEEKYWSGVKSCKLVSGKAGEVGAKYERVFDAMGKEQRVMIEVVERQPGKRTRVQSEPGPVEVTGTMVYSAADGGTRLDLTLDGKVHGMARLFGGKIRTMMQENTKESLQRLKEHLESGKGAKAAKPKTKK